MFFRVVNHNMKMMIAPMYTAAEINVAQKQAEATLSGSGSVLFMSSP